MKYIIPHPPIPWARAGVNSTTKVFFDRQKPYKRLYQYFLRSQHMNVPLIDCPVKLVVTFFMELPTTPKLRKLREKQYYHYLRPDLSNLIKFLEDAAHGIIFADDCIIAHIDAKKVYKGEARTEFEIIKIE